MCRLFFINIFIFFLSGTTLAQQVSASLDRNKILIGEQVTLQLKAEDINPRLSFVQSWFTVNDTAKHLQVVKTDKIDTVDLGGVNTYMQNVTLTSFDSGRWVLAPMKLILQDRLTGKQTILKTDSIHLDVLPVDVSSLQEYHNIKDILDVEVKPDYTLYIAVALSVIILAIIAWMVIRQMKKRTVTPPKIAYKRTALEYALEQVNELQKENLSAKNQLKIFYTKLNDILRNYFSEQLNIRSSQATSDELMVMLVVYLQDERKRTEFYQLLRLADAVKFAKYEPDEKQTKDAVETAIKSLTHIDQIIQHTRYNGS